MTSLHWNLITRWYERVLPPPYRPTLPHPFRSMHSNLRETARLVLFTVTFLRFRTIKPAWLGGNAPICFNKITCDTSHGTCLLFHTCRCVAALIRPLTLEDLHPNAVGIGLIKCLQQAWFKIGSPFHVFCGSNLCTFKSIQLLCLLGRRFSLNVPSARQYWDWRDCN